MPQITNEEGSTFLRGLLTWAIAVVVLLVLIIAFLPQFLVIGMSGYSGPEPESDARHISAPTVVDDAIWGPVNEERLVVRFDAMLTSIGNEEAGRLEQMAHAAATDGNPQFVVVGFGDEGLPDDQASALGQTRAEAVRSYLLSRGIAEDQIELTTSVYSTVPSEPAVVVARVPSMLRQLKRSYVWNSWVHDYEGDWLTPRRSLAAQSRYSVVVDLSQLEYEGDAVDTTRISKDFSEKLQSVAASGARKLVLTAIVLTDERLERVSDEPLTLEIDLTRLRAGVIDELPQTLPLVHLRDEAAPSNALLGRLMFDIQTSNAPGWASFGLSLWHDGRPFDELTFQRCISDRGGHCSDPRPDAPTLAGTELFEVAHDRAPQRPAAALHLVTLSSRLTAGVFSVAAPAHEGGQSTYLVWRIPHGAGQLASALENAQTRFMQAHQSRDATGREFANILFPTGQEDAAKARAELMQFVPVGQAPNIFPDDRPQLFVRYLHSETGPGAAYPLYPMALINLGRSPDDFLGFSAEIVSPLFEQSYGKTACPKRWAILTPRQTLGDPIDGAMPEFNRRFMGEDDLRLRVGAGFAQLFSSMATFSQWLETPREQMRDEATVLATVSHHSKDALYFTTAEQFPAANVGGGFGQDSIALLSGCSTGRPGPGGFVNKLNKAGFRSIVATSTGIESSLAGAMLESIAAQLENASEPLTVSDALRRAQNALYPRFKEAVLSFVVVGNPDAQLCSPLPE